MKCGFSRYFSMVRSRPRNPRFPIYRLCLKTAFRARMRIFKSGISGSDCKDGLTKHTKHMRPIRRFLCNNISRMGLQNTTNTRDALMIVGCSGAAKASSLCENSTDTWCSRWNAATHALPTMLIAQLHISHHNGNLCSQTNFMPPNDDFAKSYKR
jgi:hypothetical protein